MQCLSLLLVVTVFCLTQCPFYLYVTEVNDNILRPIGKDLNPASLPRNQYSFTNPMEHELMTSQGNHPELVDQSHLILMYTKEAKQEIQQSDTAVKDRPPLNIQADYFHIPASNAANGLSSHLKVERDGKSSFYSERRSKVKLMFHHSRMVLRKMEDY